jgi:cytochrome c peroxidase
MKIRIITYLIVSVFILSFTILNSNKPYYPDYFPKPSSNFNKIKFTQSEIEIGRALFFDPILSKDNTISCASCHSPFNAFAHTDHTLSHGINDSIGNRNAPAIMNLAWHKNFMWDGGIKHLSLLPIAPLTSHVEMGEDISNVLAKLNNSKIYKKLFYQTYKDSVITSEKMLKALEQFMFTIISANSKYDKVKNKQSEFNQQEQKGYQLFLNNCNSCHTEPLFSSYELANNGLNINPDLKDYGRYRISNNREDSSKFKIPSLRNLSYSYPYMHDGRFEKLSQVIEHYRTVDISKTDIQHKIQLSNNDKVDLISFLLTLNDSSFVFNPLFQYPKNLLSNKF